MLYIYNIQPVRQQSQKIPRLMYSLDFLFAHVDLVLGFLIGQPSML